MAQTMTRYDVSNPEQQANGARVYSICSFGSGSAAPAVRLIEAGSDAEAVELARLTCVFATREVWDRHRLVAVIPSTLLEPVPS